MRKPSRIIADLRRELAGELRAHETLRGQLTCALTEARDLRERLTTVSADLHDTRVAYTNTLGAQREAEDTAVALRTQVERLNEALERSEDVRRHAQEMDSAQISVLLGDRDRLTATVEILARRLASPSADRDATRAGWRANSAPVTPIGAARG